MTLILTTPVTSGITTRITDVIPPSTYKIIDNVRLFENLSVTWMVDITNNSTDETVTQQIRASLINNNIRHTRYGIIGNMLPHLIDVELDSFGPTLQLKITNLGAATYTVNIFRSN